MTTKTAVVRDMQKEVGYMSNGKGFGRGSGFRGCSPSWPYAGRGRGGLPRCLAGDFLYNPRAVGMQTTTADSEINMLRNQTQSLKQQLDLIETRIRNLEQRKEGKEE
jgi:hypothetical protein